MKYEYAASQRCQDTITLGDQKDKTRNLLLLPLLSFFTIMSSIIFLLTLYPLCMEKDSL